MAMLVRLAMLPALLALLAGVTATAQTFADEEAILQFQRAADSYAFGHRQADRRGAPLAGMAEGALITPRVAAVFRSRIRLAQANGCALGAPGANFVVPRVGASTADSAAAPPCIAAVLPKLPTELEYRIAGVALLLGDAHLHVVVDVLHGAFPDSVTP